MIGTQAFVDFYYLEAVRVKMPPIDDIVKHAIWADASEAMDELAPTFALALRDVLFMMCMGEARHAASSGFGGISWGELVDDYGNKPDRMSIFVKSSEYDPDENFPLIKEVFDSNKWDGAIGGPAWSSIVDGAMLYKKWTDIAFIDHVADLQHNGGVLFNKPEIPIVTGFSQDFSGARLKDFLGWKSEHDLLTRPYPMQTPSFRVWKILKRWWSASGHDTTITYAARDWAYNPVTWGTKILSEKRPTRELATCCMCGVTDMPGNMRDAMDGKVCFKCVSEMARCDECSVYMKPGDVTEFAGRSLCHQCYQDNARKCVDCDEEFHKYDMVRVGDDWVCYKCSKHKKYYTCYSCGNQKNAEVDPYEFLTKDNPYTKLCPQCAESLLPCNKCGEHEPPSYARHVNDKWWCRKCAEKYLIDCNNCGMTCEEKLAVEAHMESYFYHHGYHKVKVCPACAELMCVDCSVCGETFYKNAVKDSLMGPICNDCYETITDKKHAATEDDEPVVAAKPILETTPKEKGQKHFSWKYKPVSDIDVTTMSSSTSEYFTFSDGWSSGVMGGDK